MIMNLYLISRKDHDLCGRNPGAAIPAEAIVLRGWRDTPGVIL